MKREKMSGTARSFGGRPLNEAILKFLPRQHVPLDERIHE